MRSRAPGTLGDRRYHDGWRHGQADSRPQPMPNDADYTIGWVNGYASRFGISLEQASRAMESWYERHQRFVDSEIPEPPSR